MKTFSALLQLLAWAIAVPFVVLGCFCLIAAWFVAADHGRFPGWREWLHHETRPRP